MKCPLVLFAVLFLFVIPSVPAAEERQADLLVVGATESGWAAAIEAARAGVERIVIVHDGEWFGGQFTEQALACVDENKGMDKVGWGVDWHPMKRAFHRSGLFRELMDRIEAFNEEKYGSPMPGLPWHGPSTFRPAEAEAIFREMIRPWIESGRIEVFWNRYPVAAHVDRSGSHPRLKSVRFAGLGERKGEPGLQVSAPITIDASDWGEVIRLAGAGYFCGPDPRSRFGEPSAPEDLADFPPNEMNPITWAMIVEESDEETPIPRPPHFDDRNYPRATHFSRAEFGKLEWDRKARIGAIQHWPDEGAEAQRQLSVYSVRRIVEGATSRDGKTSILLNYMNGQDYPLVRLPRRVAEALEATEAGASKKNIVEMTREQRAIVFQDAKDHALGVLYHLQNFVHERATDRANSFRRFRLSGEFGTEDRLPPKPYIRESLRLDALYVMREQDGAEWDGETKNAARPRFSAVMYPDGLLSWQFHYDFHRTGRTYLVDEGDAGPWIDYEKPGRHTRFISDRCVFPARSFVPARMDGLLGAQKNFGCSSMVSAAIRLHDQCVHIGQASGAMAAVSLQEKVDPRTIPYDRELLERVRALLCGKGEGVPLLLWPWRDLAADRDDFVAINRLSALGCLPIESEEVDFRPDDPADEAWKEEARSLLAEQFPRIEGLSFSESEAMTRGEFCLAWWERIESAFLSPRPFPEKDPLDTDGDGIPDRDDALLFTPNEPVVWKVERPDPTPATDGLWPDERGSLERRFDFSGVGETEAEWDRGEPWKDSRGFGWSRDITANHRRRSVYPEAYRDTFLFTRKEDTWEVKVENGVEYEVTVCIGDSGHDQADQHVRVEGEWLCEGVDTLAGMFLEKSIVTTVNDGRISVTIGKLGRRRDTCLNWIRLRRLP